MGRQSCRQAGSSELIRRLSRAAVSVGSLPYGEQWKQIVCLGVCMTCVSICVEEPLMLLTALGAD